MKTLEEQKSFALFTNPANRKHAAALEEKQFKIFGFAPVQTQKIADAGAREIIENNLKEFDWIIFPDVFTVDYFISLLEENAIDLFELDAIRVLAFGEAVADRLRFVQLHADIIPTNIETATIFEALLSYLGKKELSGLRFLIPKEEAFDSKLKNKLSDLQAEVVEISVYKTNSLDKTKKGNLKALLRGGAIDEFVFSTPEDIISLRHYLFEENLPAIFSDTKVSATDETTFQALRENNLRPAFFRGE